MAFRDTAQFTFVNAMAGVANVGELYRLIKDAAVAAGWVIPNSGDGTNYNSSGDAIGSDAEMNTAGAWWRMQKPAAYKGHRTEFTAMRIGTGTTSAGRVKVSPSAGFTGGSPAATRTPTATDEDINCGGGNDLVGGGGTASGAGFMGAMTTNVQLLMAFDTAPPYGFYCVQRSATSPYRALGCFIFDPLVESLRYPGSEDDEWPYVVYTGDGTSGNALQGDTLDNSSVRMATYWGLGSGSAAWVKPLYAAPYGPATGTRLAPVQSGAGTVNEWTTLTQLISPVVYGGAGGDKGGIRGISSLMTWIGRLDDDLNQKVVFDHAELGAGHWVKFGDIAMPWNATVPSGHTSESVSYWDIGSWEIFEPGDESSPTITLISPEDGIITPTTPIVVEIEDDVAIAVEGILARYASGKMDVVHTGFVFGDHFEDEEANIKETFDDGLRHRFTIFRDGGWQMRSRGYGSPRLEFLVSDSSGNTAVLVVE